MTSTANEEQILEERFDLLVNAPALFNAITTAVEFGLFRFLADNPGADFEKVRAFTEVPAHQLRVLLQAVCATGLLTREDGAYRNSSVADRLLATESDDSWSHVLIGWRDVYYPAFAEMTTALRAGTNTALDLYPGDEPTLYQRLARNPQREQVFHRAMSAFTLQSVDALVERPEFASVRRLLDVGGGDGTTSARLAARYPELTCTVVDMPSVSKLGDKWAAAHPDRVDLHPADIFADPFPGGADAVLFSHVLEIFSEDQITSQLAKAHDVLPDGGTVFVYGYNVSDDETSGLYGARLGLYFNVLASGRGMAYPAGDYERWLRDVGFREVRTVRDMPYEHGLTIGVK
jgi:ubiquinone/menaquinone biosynthesis C-methylase UbiE